MSARQDAVIRAIRAAARPLLGPPEAMVLPPYDSGGVGDQAMVDATAGALAARGYATRLLHVVPTDPPIPLRTLCPSADRRTAGKRGVAQAMVDTLREDVALTLGADVIDGAYSPEVEAYRLGVLARKLRQGKPGAVLGCSISENPDPATIARLRAMPALRVHLRDEISLERFESAVGRPGVLVADVAFLLAPEITETPAREAAAWIEAHHAAGRQVLAVNASGHTFYTLDGDGAGGAAAYAAALGAWLRGGEDRATLLVPHDFRAAPVGDVAAMEAVGARLSDEFGDRVRVLRAPFHAWELKALMGRVDALLTARMHLCIAALGMGAPALCVVYAGKFEGLMRHFHLEDEALLMPPAAMMQAEDVAARIERLMAGAPALRARIEARLPEVRALAQRNFDWLDEERLA